MNCRQTALGAKEYYIENEENHVIAKDEEFTDFVVSTMEALVEDYLSNVDEEEIPKMSAFLEFLTEVDHDGEFSFAEKGDWLGNEYESALGDCADMAYDEARDRAMEDVLGI